VASSTPRFGPVCFEPVWITSREHLSHLLQIRETTPWYRLLLGRGYDVPGDFPYLASGNQRVPLVFYSTGELTIHDATANYAACPHQTGARGTSGPFELCHCTRCRKAGGSAFSAMVGVRRDDFRLTAGRELIRAYEAPVREVAPGYRTHFCGRCGSPVPNPNPETP
jgi:hypothetical protein